MLGSNVVFVVFSGCMGCVLMLYVLCYNIVHLLCYNVVFDVFLGCMCCVLMLYVFLIL